jgi:uncharacterized SAM-binding protein YcdF (DUF218 family)
MTKRRTLTISVIGTVLALFVGGFVVFVMAVSRFAPASGQKAEGIVVLTGGEQRISEAVKLLAAGRGRRLLISGVNRRTSRAKLRRLTRQGRQLFDCCIDIGYEALNTSGNANETRDWARRWGFSSLIIVTSSYHMPRSLVELGRVLPNARLIAYPVVSHKFQTTSWWSQPHTARLLMSEYLKFLPSAARLGASRLLSTFDAGAVAVVQPARAGL